MRKRIVAGNWKMNTDLVSGKDLAVLINAGIAEGKFPSGVDVILGVPFTHLSSIAAVVDFKKISLAAQNCSAFEQGAYTGEISAAMIKSTKTRYVIIGHSERRQYFQENNEEIASKVRLCLKNELIPIFCCGETKTDREKSVQFDVVGSQLLHGLFHIDDEDMQRTIIAYEPVWAIGTGLTASPAQAQEMHAFIRELLVTRYSKITANMVPLLYGGSCNAQNARQLFAQPDIDGGLIGGASLKHREFFDIINSF
ncbi:MAG: triose-phosphate isomerase [Bacteroidales bacterium]|nr:triose-phosphate isomerase [Bacteroidales bacterium]HOY38604.1 triose-phosphate isomerase [Bacteroidales bacterium]HQP04503.1 triose-phosphate isomerase [Bacteroidales bacterium]